MFPSAIPNFLEKLIAAGNIKEANELIGYNYSLYGSVVHGNQLGRTLGFPTANITLRENSPPLPAMGVYAVHIQICDELNNGIANIGNRPTIGENKLTFEIHIFDFNFDLYGQLLTVSFIDRLRNEMKFNSLHDLAIQIEKDKKMALKLFARLG
jgi:riboflavin kinase / FMN adenylyltransferase